MARCGGIDTSHIKPREQVWITNKRLHSEELKREIKDTTVCSALLSLLPLPGEGQDFLKPSCSSFTVSLLFLSFSIAQLLISRALSY
jgi:hypothetical protein